MKTEASLVSYRVKRLGFRIKNQIWVYGKASKFHPQDEGWTETLEGWVADWGTLYLNDVGQKVGLYNIRCESAIVGNSTRRALFHKTFSSLYKPKQAKFWFNVYGVASLDIAKFRVWVDASNYFETDILDIVEATWKFKEFNLGKEFEYDADKNPEGIWNKIGSPSWTKVAGIQFFVEWTSALDYNVHLDGFFFDKLRWEGFAEDAGEGSSQAKYGVKPLKPIYNDALTSDAECLIVAKEELKRRKEPPKIIEIEVCPANLNLRQGDRLRIVDEVQGIDEYARILEVQHLLGSGGFKSKLTLSTEPPSFAPEFAKVYSEIDRLEKGK